MNTRVLRVWTLPGLLLLLGTTGWARPQTSDARSLQQLGTASLSGHVVDRENKDSRLANVRVTLYREPGATAVRETLTEIDGGYSFPQLQTGSYTIRAFFPGWLPTYLGQQKPGRSGIVIALGNGESRKELTIMLFRGGAIAGRISTDNGQPLVGAIVDAFQLRASARGNAIYSMQSANTDDRGEYRLVGLSPGDYFVRAVPSVGGRTAIPGQSLRVRFKSGSGAP